MDRETQILAADDQIVSYETAILAKNKGFNYCGTTNSLELMCYDSSGNVKYAGVPLIKTLAPTQTMLARWLRENFKHMFTIWVEPYKHQGIESKYVGYVDDYTGIEGEIKEEDYKDTYEIALESLLVEALNRLPDVKLTMH